MNVRVSRCWSERHSWEQETGFLCDPSSSCIPLCWCYFTTIIIITIINISILHNLLMLFQSLLINKKRRRILMSMCRTKVHCTGEEKFEKLHFPRPILNISMESNCPWKKETIPQIGWAPLWNQHSTSYGWGAVSVEVISLASRRQARQNYTGNRESPWTSNAFPPNSPIVELPCYNYILQLMLRPWSRCWGISRLRCTLNISQLWTQVVFQEKPGCDHHLPLPRLQHLMYNMYACATTPLHTAMCFVSKLPLHTLSHRHTQTHTHTDRHTWCCC